MLGELRVRTKRRLYRYYNITGCICYSCDCCPKGLSANNERRAKSHKGRRGTRKGGGWCYLPASPTVATEAMMNILASEIFVAVRGDQKQRMKPAEEDNTKTMHIILLENFLPLEYAESRNFSVLSTQFVSSNFPRHNRSIAHHCTENNDRYSFESS